MKFKTKQNGSARVKVRRAGFSRKRMDLLGILMGKKQPRAV